MTVKVIKPFLHYEVGRVIDVTRAFYKANTDTFQVMSEGFMPPVKTKEQKDKETFVTTNKSNKNANNRNNKRSQS